MALAYFGIKELPDLNLNKYQTLSETGVGGVLKRQSDFLRLWIRVCSLYQLSMHFLVQYRPERAAGNRISVGIVLQGDEANVKEASPFMLSSPLKENYLTFCQSDESLAAMKEAVFQHGYALIKRERMLDSVKQGMEPYHYVPEWTINEECRLIDLYKMMSAIGQPCLYRVDLYPDPLTDQTRAAFSKTITKLRELTGYGGADRVQLTDVRHSRQRDSNAEEALRQYEQWIEAIETSPHCRANIYAFASEEAHARLLLDCAGSEAVQEGEYTLLPLGGAPFSFNSRLGNTAENLAKQMPSSLSFWPTSFTCIELSAFFKLPALFEGEEIDIPKETMPGFPATGLLLGKSCNVMVNDVFFPIEKLNRHAFISGVPGSGKTNTMLLLASALWKEFVIPFLVFEPAKKEYRALLNDPEMSDVLLFSPSAGTRLPLAINPFAFPKGLTLSEHIAALMQVFAGAFEVHGPVHFFLDRSIQTAYESLGWKSDDINMGTLPYPRLTDVQKNFEKEIGESGYDGELRGNLNTFLQVRIGGLLTRELSEVFDVSESSLQPEEWLKHPAIIELEAMPSCACNFLILLLCTLIREALRANPYADREKTLRHVIFIEEAHNLIAPQTEQGSADMIDPKVSATAYIVKMLAEVRALREGIIIADQIPTAMASEVLKNTGLKITHRLTSQDDRALIGTTMSATEMQMEALSTFETGESLIFHEGLQVPYKMKAYQWEMGRRDAALYEGKSNADLYMLLKERNTAFKYGLMNALLNTVDFVSNQYLTQMDKVIDTVMLELYDLLDAVEDAEPVVSDRPGHQQLGFTHALNVCRERVKKLSQLIDRAKTTLSNAQERFDVSVTQIFGAEEAIRQREAKRAQIVRAIMSLSTKYFPENP